MAHIQLGTLVHCHHLDEMVSADKLSASLKVHVLGQARIVGYDLQELGKHNHPY